MAFESDTLAVKVRELVARHGLTQGDVGVVLRLSQQAVSDRMTGRTPWRMGEVEALAASLNVEVRVELVPVDAARAAA